MKQYQANERVGVEQFFTTTAGSPYLAGRGIRLPHPAAKYTMSQFSLHRRFTLYIIEVVRPPYI